MALPISLSSEYQGIARADDSRVDAQTLDRASKLLQKNHDEYNMFWREVGGHNHIVHSILTVLALGADAADVQRAFDDDFGIQLPRVPSDPKVVSRLSDPAVFLDHMNELDNYGSFLAYFKQQIGERGWRPVVTEYCFSRTRIADLMLARLFEGLYHPIIHLGLGIEFDIPAVIAEALAMTACHNSDGIDNFFFECERLASKSSAPAGTTTPLVQLLEEARADQIIRHAAHPTDGPVCVKDGVLGRACPEMAAVAARYRVPPERASLRNATAEAISCAAYIAGAAQRPGKTPIVDFFYLHIVTSSLFLSVLGEQDWIDVADLARLVEWKARLDLVWYAASGTAALHREAITAYVPGPSAGMGWPELYRAVLAQHDDGHLAKFVRALKHGHDVEVAGFVDPDQAHLPVQQDMWLRIAQMAYDTTLDKPDVLEKWLFGTGFDDRWEGRS